MKNIINWTLGGFFRSIGRILSFIVIGGLIALLIAKSGLKVPDWLKPLYIVNASSVDYTYKKYRVRYYSLATGDSALTSVTDMGTATTFSSGYGIEMVSARFGWSSRFQAGTTYRVTIDVGFGGLETTFLNIDNFACFGSSTTSSWDAQENLISTCNFIGSSLNNSGRVNYMFDITPLSNVQGIQFNIYLGVTEEVSAVNVRPTSTVTYGDDPTGAINEQTIVIEQEFENITNIINENNQNLINSITEQNQVCEIIDKNKIVIDGKYLNSNNGDLISNSSYGITDFIKVGSNDKMTIASVFTWASAGYCFYTVNKTLISCSYTSGHSVGDLVTIPATASYFRTSIHKDYNLPTFQLCRNGNQAMNDILTDTDTSSDSNGLADYINNFNLSIEGPLSSIITLPINMLRNLIVDYNDNNTHADLCTTFQGQNICLPSGDILWKRTGCHDNRPFGCPNYSAFKTFFQLVAGGFIYWQILKRLVKSVEKGLDPSESGVNLMRL